MEELMFSVKDNMAVATNDESINGLFVMERNHINEIKKDKALSKFIGKKIIEGDKRTIDELIKEFNEQNK